MKKIFEFLKSKTFFKHLGIAVVSLVLLFWLIFKWLDIYTHHGKTVAVPDFNGLKQSSLPEFIKGKQLKFLVIDSVYDTKKDKGVVIRQEPEAGMQVKQDRTIYLYVTSVLPPRIPMPALESRSLRQAVRILETYGLKLAKQVKHKPDVCKGCVLRAEYKGKPIKDGTLIERGSEITLVVGEGQGGGASVAVPNLIGMTMDEAIEKLNQSDLSQGALIFDKGQKEKRDSSTAKVYRQSPGPGGDNEISVGSSVDLYLTNDKSKIKAASQDPK